LSAFPLVFAVEAVDEVGHGLVGPARLHLEVRGLLALALLAREEALRPRLQGLLLQLLRLEVRARRIQALLQHLLTQLLDFLARQVLRVAGHQELGGEFIRDRVEAEVRVFVIRKVEDKCACAFVVVGGELVADVVLGEHALLDVDRALGGRAQELLVIAEEDGVGLLEGLDEGEDDLVAHRVASANFESLRHIGLTVRSLHLRDGVLLGQSGGRVCGVVLAFFRGFLVGNAPSEDNPLPLG
jgi:hypothetical protein